MMSKNTFSVSRWDCEAYVVQVAFLAGTEVLGAGFGDGTVRFLQPGQNDFPRQYRVHEGAVLAFAADPVRRVFLSGGDDGRLCRIDPAGRVEEVASFPGKWIEGIAVHGQGGLFAAAAGKNVYLHRADAPSRTHELGPHAGTVAAIAFSPDGAQLASAHYNGISLWAVPEPSTQPQVIGWKGSHLSVCYSPDARYLASTTQDKCLHVWSFAEQTHLLMDGYGRKTKALAWTAGGAFLFTGGTSGFVCLPFEEETPEKGAPIQFGQSEDAFVTAVATHPVISLAAAGFSDGSLSLGDTDSLRTFRLKDPGDGEISALAWSPDGSRLAAGDSRGNIWIFVLAP